MKYLVLLFVLINGNPSFSDTGPLSKKSLNYDIQWGHIVIGQITASLEKKYNGFILKLKSESKGPLSLLYNYKSKLFASSFKEDGVWKAKTYITDSSVRNQKYYSRVNWHRKDKKVDFQIDPPLDLDKVYAVAHSTLENVIDPFTAILKVIEKVNNNKPCNSSVRIFDGRRRYNLSIKELEKKYLINDRPRSFMGNAVVCGIRVTPIGGHRIKSQWKPEIDKFSDIKIFFGTVDEDTHLPVRMHLNRWFGEITLRLLKSDY